jgi:hypothetical protein
MLGFAALLLASQASPSPRAEAPRWHAPSRPVAASHRGAREARMRALDQAVERLDPDARATRLDLRGPSGL